MDKSHDNIPENCDKILFAEDVVSHIFFRNLQVRYQPKIATPYREFIYQGFNEFVKAALDDICKRIMEYNTIFNVEHQLLNRNQFHRFAIFMMKRYFTEGFDPKYFLIYCVHLSMAAEEMANIIGLQSAGDLAVKYVLKGFRNYDMFTGGWDVLHIMASRYANGRDFMEDVTPEIEIMGAQFVEDNEVLLSDEDLEEDNELPNAEVANVLVNENDENIYYKKIDEDERNCDKKTDDDKHKCDKKLGVHEDKSLKKLGKDEHNCDKKVDDEHNCDKKIDDEHNCDKKIDDEHSCDKKIDDEHSCDKKIDDEHNCDQKIDDDEDNSIKKLGIHEDEDLKKQGNDEHNCEKKLDLEKNRKELENSKIKICLAELKDIIEKEVEPDIFESTSDSYKNNEASIEQSKHSSFQKSSLSETEKRNLPSFSKSNSCSMPDEKNNTHCSNAKNFATAAVGKRRSPKRNHKGVEINRIFSVLGIPHLSFNFSSCDLMRSKTKSVENFTEIRENASNTSKRPKIICEETSNLRE